MSNQLRVIVTGASGMVGEGVMMECLNSSEVKEVLVIGRRTCGHTHPKLKEILLKDMYDISPIAEQLKGYDACYFCLGTSSVGMNEEDYTKITYTLTLNFANVLVKQSPDAVFCYVSGGSTDSSEKGSVMWARVKGKTENDLMKLPFKNVYAFRPGFMKASKGQKNLLPVYKYLAWTTPVVLALLPKYSSTLAVVGDAMIKATTKSYEKKVLEVKDIKILAAR